MIQLQQGICPSNRQTGFKIKGCFSNDTPLPALTPADFHSRVGDSFKRMPNVKPLTYTTHTQVSNFYLRARRIRLTPLTCPLSYSPVTTFHLSRRHRKVYIPI
jgi:hypothetical protein